MMFMLWWLDGGKDEGRGLNWWPVEGRTVVDLNQVSAIDFE